MKKAHIRILLMLFLNASCKTTKSILTEAEFKLVPELMKLELIKACYTNKNYHYLNTQNDQIKMFVQRVELLKQELEFYTLF